MAFLEVDDIKTYYGNIQALKGVTLDVNEGECVTLIGSNGAGKSTTLRSISGLTPVREGKIRLAGDQIEHLQIVGAKSSAAWTPDRVYELFPRLGERKQVSGTSLSGGEQQMLAIGRALLTNPKVLIMDEPSEGLAPTIVEGLVQTIKDLAAEGMGLLVVEQNLGVATSLAERQLIMVTGQIATETTAAELAADPAAQRRYLGVEPLADAA